MSSDAVRKNVIRVVAVFSFLLFGVFIFFPYVVKVQYLNALVLSLSGQVIEIQWRTSNHNLPLFKIKSAKGVVTLNDGELMLRNTQIKIGDTIVKEKGSRTCKINGSEIICVRNYVSFRSMMKKEFGI